MTPAELIDAVSVDAYSLALLLLISVNLRKFYDLDKCLLNLLYGLLAVTMCADANDMLGWIVDGRSGQCFFHLNYIINTLGVILVPLPAIIYYFIMVYMINKAQAVSRRHIIFCSASAAVFVLLALTNPLTHMIFTIDSFNRYHRGPLFVVFYAAVFLFLIITAIRIYTYHGEQVIEILAAQLFWLPPLIGAVTQYLFYGINLSLAGITISILMLYIGFQTKSNRLDYLTGVHNRRYMDVFINAMVRQSTFSAVILDIDHYKMINDNYGHHVGDEVLVSIASVLKVSTRHQDCVARYGGDEFVIIINSGDINVLYAIISRINYQIFQLNNSSGYEFAVSVSMGYDVFNKEIFQTGREFIKHIDAMMYANKQKKSKNLLMKQESEIQQK